VHENLAKAKPVSLLAIEALVWDAL
jgi:hypothetical protein